LLEAQEQVETATEEVGVGVGVARNFLRADIVTNAIHILDKSETTWTSKFKSKKCSTKNFSSTLIY
jgi:hypothetical protein